MQGFVSSSQRFTPAAAPVAAPDYGSWDGEPNSLRGDAARLGPGAYVQLVGGSITRHQPSNVAPAGTYPVLCRIYSPQPRAFLDSKPVSCTWLTCADFACTIGLLRHLQDDWGGKAAGRGSRPGRHHGYHTAPFGSEAQRSSPALTAVTAAKKGATPGPGAYSNATVDMKQVFRPLSVPGGGAGFSTGSKRFSSSTSVSPGPGAYIEDVAHSCSLVRPSYNVTLDC
jgi:hypothetical protein